MTGTSGVSARSRSRSRDSSTIPPARWRRAPSVGTGVEGGPLETELGVPVGLISIPAATLVGEIISGAAAEHDDAVLVFLSHGVGAGSSRGRLVVGAGGAVGELVLPRRQWTVVHVRRVGCLETVAAGWAIRAEASAGLRRPELEQGTSRSWRSSESRGSTTC